MKKNIIIIKYNNQYRIKLEYAIEHFGHKIKYVNLTFFVLKNTFPNKKSNFLSQYNNFALNSILKEDSVKFYQKKYALEYLKEIKNNPITLTVLANEHHIILNKNYALL